MDLEETEKQPFEEYDGLSDQTIQPIDDSQYSKRQNYKSEENEERDFELSELASTFNHKLTFHSNSTQLLKCRSVCKNSVSFSNQDNNASTQLESSYKLTNQYQDKQQQQLEQEEEEEQKQGKQEQLNQEQVQKNQPKKKNEQEIEKQVNLTSGQINNKATENAQNKYFSVLINSKYSNFFLSGYCQEDQDKYYKFMAQICKKACKRRFKNRICLSKEFWLEINKVLKEKDNVNRDEAELLISLLRNYKKPILDEVENQIKNQRMKK